MFANFHAFMKKVQANGPNPLNENPNLVHELTDQEAICYIQNNDLGYRFVGNDLNKAREHWKTVGYSKGLSYVCSSDPQMQHDLTVAQNQLTDVSNDYKDYVDKAEEDVKDILRMEVTDMPFVIRHVKQQNKVLADQLTADKSDVLTHNQLATHEVSKMRSLDYFNGFYFWVYWLAVIVFGLLLLGMKPELSLKFKAFIVAFFCAYLWIIEWIELGLWYIVMYLRSFVYGTVF
jgi:hypothetical protein